MPVSDKQTHSTEYDATLSPICSVTVYQADRAEITRIITVDLLDGQNEIEVKNLPSCLDQSSIRVDGIGDTVVSDVVCHPPNNSSSGSYHGAGKELTANRTRLQEEIAIISQQSDILKDYSKTLAGSDIPLDQLQSFLKIYAEQQKEQNAQISELTKKVAVIDYKVQTMYAEYNARTASARKRGSHVTIVVNATKPDRAELSLKYIVKDAQWAPHYDLRASVSAGNESDFPADARLISIKESSDTSVAAMPKIQLRYCAYVAQRTGEDWTGVALTLSPASPVPGTDIPHLKPNWIAERKSSDDAKSGTNAYSSANFASSWGTAHIPQASPSVITKKVHFDVPSKNWTWGSWESEIPSIEYYDDNYGSVKPQMNNVDEKASTDSILSSSFEISGHSNIPSDLDNSKRTHKVTVAQLELKTVDFEWITVPKELPSAFLQCKIKNTSNYVLLPGPAKVFMNGNFVAKSSIPHVSPQEAFTCSLGLDPALHVTYHPQTEKLRTVSGSLLPKTISGVKEMNVTSFERRIALRNTRARRAHRVRVREQTPISRDARFKVNIVKPSALNAPDAGSKVRKPGQSPGAEVCEGVRVQWVPCTAQPEDASAVMATSSVARPSKVQLEEELTSESAQGLMEWVCDIDAGGSIDVVLAWEVSAPVGVEWEFQ